MRCCFLNWKRGPEVKPDDITLTREADQWQAGSPTFTATASVHAGIMPAQEESLETQDANVLRAEEWFVRELQVPEGEDPVALFNRLQHGKLSRLLKGWLAKVFYAAVLDALKPKTDFDAQRAYRENLGYREAHLLSLSVDKVKEMLKDSNLGILRDVVQPALPHLTEETLSELSTYDDILKAIDLPSSANAPAYILGLDPIDPAKNLIEDAGLGELADIVVPALFMLIREVHPKGWVERLRRLPLSDDDNDRLHESDVLHNFLATPLPETGLLPVRLVRWSWLLERADKVRAARSAEERMRLALPCRQQLELEDDSTFIPAEEVSQCLRRNRFRVAVFSTSYCWRTPEHPDPEGTTLLALADFLQPRKPLSEFGVFFDWCSVHQKPSGRPRTQEEQATFKLALANLDLLYAHSMTTTVALTDLAGTRPYHDRGWPSFEYAVSSLAKSSHLLHWDPFLDASQLGKSPLTEAPCSPNFFVSMIKTKHFTNGKDDLPAVIGLYERTVACAFRGIQKLICMDRNWTPEEFVRFLPLLELCGEETGWLVLSRNTGLVGASGSQELARAIGNGVLPGLSCLDMCAIGINDEGACALAAALPCAPALQSLTLDGNDIGDKGARAFAENIPSARSLARLSLLVNKVGSEACRELEAACVARGVTLSI